MSDIAATDPLPKPKRDLAPLLLPVLLALLMLPLVGSASSWVTLTVASLAMGMMIFIMASGLTLVFGLMDVAPMSQRWSCCRSQAGRRPIRCWPTSRYWSRPHCCRWA